MPKEPVSVHCIPIKNRPNDPVFFENEPLVDAARGITKYDILAAFAVGEISCREQINTCLLYTSPSPRD